MERFQNQQFIGLAVRDFDNNTKLDLVVANGGNNSISILLNNGNGTFQNQTAYTVVSDPSSITVGDFR